MHGHDDDRARGDRTRRRALPAVDDFEESTDEDFGDGPQVQRSSVEEVVGRRGGSLPPEVQRFAEASYGEDFSGVQVHSDGVAMRSAKELRARAYTSGEHVVAPRDLDMHTWLHELDHVRTQRRGLVEGGTDRGDGVRVSHPSDEQEKAADVNATRALSGDHPVVPGPTAAGDGGGPTVQRALKVGGTQLTTTSEGARNQVQQVWAEVASLPAFQARGAEERTAMEAQFWKWVQEVPGTETGRSPWGRKAQNRTYARVDDLETALHGWVAAKPGRRAEKQYAQEIIRNPEVDLQLNSLLYRVVQKIDSLADSEDDQVAAKYQDVLRELQQATTSGPVRGNPDLGNHERPRGWYQYYLAMNGTRADPQVMLTIREGVLDVLVRPTNYTFLDKAVVLHDLMEYFGDQRPWNPRGAGNGLMPAPAASMIDSTAGIREDGTRATTPDRGRTDQGTRNEQARSTRFARQHDLPVWSGASNTTIHMLNLARWVDATLEESTALAHSIFAFWRVYYDHTSLAPHTLHEVMDVAQNFDVPYDPLDRYQGLAHDDVEAEQAALRRNVEDRIADVSSMLSDLSEWWEGRDDDPRLGEFLRARETLLAVLRTFTDDFDGAETPDARRVLIRRALHAATHVDLAIKRFARGLRDDDSSDSDS